MMEKGGRTMQRWKVTERTGLWVERKRTAESDLMALWDPSVPLVNPRRHFKLLSSLSVCSQGFNTGQQSDCQCLRNIKNTDYNYSLSYFDFFARKLWNNSSHQVGHFGDMI